MNMLSKPELNCNSIGIESDDCSITNTTPSKPIKITPTEFFESIAVNSPGGIQGVITAGSTGAPNTHHWRDTSANFGPWAAEFSSGKVPAYFTMAAFTNGSVSRYNGRTQDNVCALGGFWIDIEGSEEKYAKPDGQTGGYPDGKAALEAVRAFVHATAIKPNFLVFTGSGGVHLHYVLTEPIDRQNWYPRARALVELASRHGLKIDAQCTTDAARIMRAPGSLHQKTGKLVLACRWRESPFTIQEWDRLTQPVGVVETSVQPRPVANLGQTMHDANSVLSSGIYHPFSYVRAAEKCAAMRQAAQRNGCDVGYPVWLLAAKAADLSTEGREFAHDISCGHEEYDRDDTDKKINSLTGGPAGCEAWANAYGAGGPCESCEWRDKIRNPAVQLGTEVDVTPPGEVALNEAQSLPDWVRELNKRFAVVRHGSKMVIVDFQTPSMSGHGMEHGMGYIDTAAFRQMHRGRFAPKVRADERTKQLADAWLEHQGRRQYAGLVFAPGKNLPANILNLWRGFAVDPVAGDVSLWLELLAALIPGEVDRSFVLRWLAWKIQNPGGVPDTILIFKGAKGTGKNSLFDPVILLFGRHAMLADDPELIAGRFTWHLMSLSFAVLDEAVFIQDPRQADRIKSRVTAKTMMYEQKGMDPVQGVNCCAFVMLTNHEYVWQATSDERRAVVIEVGEALRGDLDFWSRYHTWAAGPGPAALLSYLQGIDLTGFNPRQIPKGEALRKQVEQTALREPAAAWWHQCLEEGTIRWRDGTGERLVQLADDTETEIDRLALRLSYEQSAAARGRASAGWPSVARRIKGWVGPSGIRSIRVRNGTGRERLDVFPPLPDMRRAFTAATHVQFPE